MNEQRVQWIKCLRQRDGLATVRPDVPLELFNATDSDDLVQTLQVAFSFLPMSPATAALENALNLPDLDDEEPPRASSVIQRRSEFADKEGVSVRTIERLEEEAVLALDRVLTEMQDADFLRLQLVAVDDALDRLRLLLRHWGEPLPASVSKGMLRLQDDLNTQVEGAVRRIEERSRE